MKTLKKELVKAISERNLDWKLVESSDEIIKMGLSTNRFVFSKNEKENNYRLVCFIEMQELEGVEDVELIELGLYFCSKDYDNLPDADILIADMHNISCLWNNKEVLGASR